MSTTREICYKCGAEAEMLPYLHMDRRDGSMVYCCEACAEPNYTESDREKLQAIVDRWANRFRDSDEAKK